MSKHKKTVIVSAVVISTMMLSGCSLFGGDNKVNDDPPKKITYSDNAAKESGNTTAKETNAKAPAENSIATELYLLDKDGYVVPQTVNLPKTKSIATESLQYLVKNGPVTDLLPNGFQAVIPQDTKVSVNIKDKVATVDFSKEFKEYKKEEEAKILQSITWTLTQFDSVDSVKLQINGKELTEMPVDGTPIQGPLTRSIGINIDTNDITDITNTKPLTVYYIGGEASAYYYVPVTKRVSNTEDNNITAAVEELVNGPGQNSPLVSGMATDVALLNKPTVEDGKVTLNFNDSIYNSFNDEEKTVSDDVLNSLVLSLTEQEGIESVTVEVNGKADLQNEEGKNISEPVSRPQKVNTGSY
ncbi:GerMN domain-containing protein [Niallia sp. 01092]|uniref:GerMN domain-containing protein n=1 Tax=unclassified Niallia TaxID=2837522 RepID=UPI003FCF0F0F